MESMGTLNPIAYSQIADFRIFLLAYDFMYQLGPDGKHTPSLAESANISDEGKTWTFKMRPGVKFHDGTPLTAKDAAFTLNLFKKRDDSPSNFLLGAVDKAEAPDDNTLVLRLNATVPDMPDLLSNFPILPEYVWAPQDDGSKKVMEFKNDALIGSGPFKLIKYTPGKSIRLAAIEDHWSVPAKLDEVEVRFDLDFDAQAKALSDGDLDAIYSVTTLKAIDDLRAMKGVQVYQGGSEYPAVQLIALNQLDPAKCPKDAVCNGHPALRDVKVRQAIMHALDRNQLAAAYGLGKPGISLMPGGLGQWSNASLEGYAFDVDKANQMLADAGYKDVDNDGIREMPDGKMPLVLRHLYASDADFTKPIDAYVTQALKQIGMKVEGKGMLVSELVAGPGLKFDYDLISFGWTGFGLEPASFLPMAQSSGIGSTNFAGYANADFDALANQQGVESDSAKRKDMLWKLQEMLDEDAVYIVVSYPDAATAHRTDRFTGWPTDSTLRIMLLYPSVLANLTVAE